MDPEHNYPIPNQISQCIGERDEVDMKGQTYTSHEPDDPLDPSDWLHDCFALFEPSKLNSRAFFVKEKFSGMTSHCEKKRCSF